MINKNYINEANRIRKTYFKVLENVKDKEDIINGYKSKITDIMDNLESYVNSVDDVDNTIQENLNKYLIDIELNIDKIRHELIPLNSAIEQLKKESTILYNNIKDLYPNMSDSDIQKEVFNGLEI